MTDTITPGHLSTIADALDKLSEQVTELTVKVDAILVVHQYVQDQIEEIRPKVEPTLKMIDDFKTSTVGKMLTGG